MATQIQAVCKGFLEKLLSVELSDLETIPKIFYSPDGDVETFLRTEAQAIDCNLSEISEKKESNWVGIVWSRGNVERSDFLPKREFRKIVDDTLKTDPDSDEHRRFNYSAGQVNVEFQFLSPSLEKLDSIEERFIVREPEAPYTVKYPNNFGLFNVTPNNFEISGISFLGKEEFGSMVSMEGSASLLFPVVVETSSAKVIKSFQTEFFFELPNPVGNKNLNIPFNSVDDSTQF